MDHGGEDGAAGALGADLADGLAVEALGEVERGVVLEVFELHHKEEVAPFVVVDNGDVTHFEDPSDGLFSFKGSVSSLRVIRVTVLLNNIDNVELSALLQTQILQIQVLILRH